jgi:hypothetical protein
MHIVRIERNELTLEMKAEMKAEIKAATDVIDARTCLMG